MLDPIIYANELTRKIKIHNAEVWLVNTGWTGGPYGIGTRIDLTYTRLIVEAILNDSLKNCEFKTLPVFNLNIPSKIEGIDGTTLDPAKAWESTSKWRVAATDLALKFINNFNKFTSNKESESLVSSGPVI
jgi:phosphoenolpyruvate carboxykinase (ATP)